MSLKQARFAHICTSIIIIIIIIIITIIIIAIVVIIVIIIIINVTKRILVLLLIPQHVCGQCGVLFDVSYPLGAHDFAMP